MMSYWEVLKSVFAFSAYAVVSVGVAMALAEMVRWYSGKRNVLRFVLCFVVFVVVSSFLFWGVIVGAKWLKIW